MNVKYHIWLPYTCCVSWYAAVIGGDTMQWSVVSLIESSNPVRESNAWELPSAAEDAIVRGNPHGGTSKSELWNPIGESRS